MPFSPSPKKSSPIFSPLLSSASSRPPKPHLSITPSPVFSSAGMAPPTTNMAIPASFSLSATSLLGEKGSPLFKKEMPKKRENSLPGPPPPSPHKRGLH